MHRVHRYHDICMGHRVTGHESKCQHLHGHNYRVHFTCIPEDNLDSLGRVIDFSVVKEKLCMWLEEFWDHKFMAWRQDPIMTKICTIVALDAFHDGDAKNAEGVLDNSMVWSEFNPTAENMAQYLVEEVGPVQLKGTGVILESVRIEETHKCHASFGI